MSASSSPRAAIHDSTHGVARSAKHAKASSSPNCTHRAALSHPRKGKGGSYTKQPSGSPVTLSRARATRGTQPRNGQGATGGKPKARGSPKSGRAPLTLQPIGANAAPQSPIRLCNSAPPLASSTTGVATGLQCTTATRSSELSAVGNTSTGVAAAGANTGSGSGAGADTGSGSGGSTHRAVPSASHAQGSPSAPTRKLTSRDIAAVATKARKPQTSAVQRKPRAKSASSMRLGGVSGGNSSGTSMTLPRRPQSARAGSGSPKLRAHSNNRPQTAGNIRRQPPPTGSQRASSLKTTYTRDCTAYANSRAIKATLRGAGPTGNAEFELGGRNGNIVTWSKNTAIMKGWRIVGINGVRKKPKALKRGLDSANKTTSVYTVEAWDPLYSERVFDATAKSFEGGKKPTRKEAGAADVGAWGAGGRGNEEEEAWLNKRKWLSNAEENRLKMLEAERLAAEAANARLEELVRERLAAAGAKTAKKAQEQQEEHARLRDMRALEATREEQERQRALALALKAEQEREAEAERERERLAAAAAAKHREEQARLAALEKERSETWRNLACRSRTELTTSLSDQYGQIAWGDSTPTPVEPQPPPQPKPPPPPKPIARHESFSKLKSIKHMMLEKEAQQRALATRSQADQDTVAQLVGLQRGTPPRKFDTRGALKLVKPKQSVENPQRVLLVAMTRAQAKHRNAWATQSSKSVSGARKSKSGTGTGSGVTVPGTVLRQPSDRSSLFHALVAELAGYSSRGGRSTAPADLRQEVGDYVERSAETLVAGTPLKDWVMWDADLSPGEYAACMRQGSHWGGAIEIAVLATLKMTDVHVYNESHITTPRPLFKMVQTILI